MSRSKCITGFWIEDAQIPFDAGGNLISEPTIRYPNEVARLDPMLSVVKSEIGQEICLFPHPKNHRIPLTYSGYFNLNLL